MYFSMESQLVVAAESLQKAAKWKKLVNFCGFSVKFPDLQEKLKAVMTSDMEVVIKDEM